MAVCSIGYIFDADGQKIADFWCKNNYEAQKKIDNYIKSNNLDEKKIHTLIEDEEMDYEDDIQE